MPERFVIEIQEMYMYVHTLLSCSLCMHVINFIHLVCECYLY